jgi:hypothetical protein
VTAEEGVQHSTEMDVLECHRVSLGNDAELTSWACLLEKGIKLFCPGQP